MLTAQTEIYNVAVHGSHFVTAGYGRESGDVNDWVSLRMDVNTAALDPAWGGATDGKLQFDVSGTGVADNCRNAVALPGGKTLLVGSTGPGNMPAQDAAFAVLTATGQKDTDYGTGIQVQHFGAENTGNDQYWGAAVSGDHILLVGFRGGGAAATQTASMNDDAFAAIMPVR